MCFCLWATRLGSKSPQDTRWSRRDHSFFVNLRYFVAGLQFTYHTTGVVTCKGNEGRKLMYLNTNVKCVCIAVLKAMRFSRCFPEGVVEMIYYIIMGFWSLRFLLKWEYVKNYKYFIIIIIIARRIAFNFIVYLYWLLSI